MDGTSAGTGAAGARAGPAAVRRGTGTTTPGWEQVSEVPSGTLARAPPFRVNHPSAGQVSDLIVWTTSVPTEPSSASRQRAGVADADTSVQRRPGMPTRTTGWDGEPVAAARSAWPIPALLAETVLARAGLARTAAPADHAAPRAAPSSSPPASVFFIPSTVSGRHQPRIRFPASAASSGDPPSGDPDSAEARAPRLDTCIHTHRPAG